MAAMMEMPSIQMPQAALNPRKRKKRAPAAGAANDCFTCAERKLKCDRRRPYCSQCLQVGQDCSGYKTQLTWGVGVASRGKLRGLSLPIAGTQKFAPVDVPPKTKQRRDTNGEIPRISVQSPTQIAPALEQDHKVQQSRAVVPARTSPEATTPGSTRSSNQAAIWDPTLFSAPHMGSFSVHTSQPTSQSYYANPNSVSPSYAGVSHQAGVAFAEEVWTNQPVPVTASYLTPNSAATPTAGPNHGSPTNYFDRPSNNLSTSSGLVSPAQLSFSDEVHRPSHAQGERQYDGISMLLQADQSMQLPTSDGVAEADQEVSRAPHDECAVSDELALQPGTSQFDLTFPMPVLSGISNIGKTARMQYLINYYAEVISPVIVAFDSPSNPFRTQILRLAESSETLQHAISALAASNLRQRQGIGLLSTGKTAPARRSSFAHVHLMKDYAQTFLSPEEQMREETLHKRLAVSQLNQQLAHPILRKDDSILATLLMLCLFHICDSGIAKFQTQFAGVRKLLALRGDNLRIGSEDSKWMSRLFTWFDSLAATVNDREGQITGSFLEVSALCGDWSLENMVGIETQMFKSISKLARLNLLRQGKGVEATEPFMVGPMPVMPFPPDMSFDGNGWMRQDSGVGLGLNGIDPDTNKQFWREWQAVRNDLLSWRLDTTLFDSLSNESSSLTVDQRMDLENISQSFRYSALVYLERLAQPQLSSNDEAIQMWVRQSLSYVKKVVSDVYLLWPLFITGTECVDEEGRNVIRGRCADIQKDSGFVNNASCLQLLERVWSASSPHSSPVSDGDSTSTGSGGSDLSTSSAFMFRDVMMKEAASTEGQGEYLVV
ncbi:hypothetical protein LTR70_001139 [Exophiala xenobiotica]|uniref:Zn(2)-C6 fungal-type domain-containing protein n=1 Tax=Lithohypha guttulata TaxID=1690604 RepID=A0ABR0KMM1_9EURO|nr:hypothetical protein LTR24_000672 [Lithohypha guttulata]KAK5328985.1 hypothetical protein LTR70_001139 [Exophiala xenobiotica]